MKFKVRIRTANGSTRVAEFESMYDANSVLVEHVKSDILEPGEEIVMEDPPRDGHDRDRKQQVPRIERVA